MAIIAGIGQSDVGRRLAATTLSLTIDAVTAAVSDAGLTLRDVDGVAIGPPAVTAVGASTVTPVAAAVELRFGAA